MVGEVGLGRAAGGWGVNCGGSTLAPPLPPGSRKRDAEDMWQVAPHLFHTPPLHVRLLLHRFLTVRQGKTTFGGSGAHAGPRLM